MVMIPGHKTPQDLLGDRGFYTAERSDQIIGLLRWKIPIVVVNLDS
jgi:hypothetical protein